MIFFRNIWPMILKDLISELRSKEILISMGLFAFLVLVVFNFAFSPGSEVRKEVLSGMLWVAFIFSGLLGLNQTFGAEKESGSLQGLLLCPVSRGTLYVGKVISNFLFMTMMEIFVLILFAILFRASLLPSLFPLSLVVFLGTMGFASVGTIFSAMSVNARAREMFLAVILFPILVPLLIASVKATGNLFEGKSFTEIYGWLRILVAFDLLFFVLSYWTFGIVLEE